MYVEYKIDFFFVFVIYKKNFKKYKWNINGDIKNYFRIKTVDTSAYVLYIYYNTIMIGGLVLLSKIKLSIDYFE